jgi:hypothetical protein
MPPVPASRSPFRKISELSGRARLEVPVRQLPFPVAGADTVLTMQVLVGVLVVFGIGSGAPKRQPVSVQLRLLPVWAAVRPANVSAPVPLLHALTLVFDVPRSGSGAGSGTLSEPVPK